LNIIIYFDATIFPYRSIASFYVFVTIVLGFIGFLLIFDGGLNELAKAIWWRCCPALYFKIISYCFIIIWWNYDWRSKT